MTVTIYNILDYVTDLDNNVFHVTPPEFTPALFIAIQNKKRNDTIENISNFIEAFNYNPLLLLNNISSYYDNADTQDTYLLFILDCMKKMILLKINTLNYKLSLNNVSLMFDSNMKNDFSHSQFLKWLKEGMTSDRLSIVLASQPINLTSTEATEYTNSIIAIDDYLYGLELKDVLLKSINSYRSTTSSEALVASLCAQTNLLMPLVDEYFTAAHNYNETHEHKDIAIDGVFAIFVEPDIKLVDALAYKVYYGINNAIQNLSINQDSSDCIIRNLLNEKTHNAAIVDNNLFKLRHELTDIDPPENPIKPNIAVFLGNQISTAEEIEVIFRQYNNSVDNYTKESTIIINRIKDHIGDQVSVIDQIDKIISSKYADIKESADAFIANNSNTQYTLGILENRLKLITEDLASIIADIKLSPTLRTAEFISTVEKKVVCQAIDQIGIVSSLQSKSEKSLNNIALANSSMGKALASVLRKKNKDDNLQSEVDAIATAAPVSASAAAIELTEELSRMTESSANQALQAARPLLESMMIQDKVFQFMLAMRKAIDSSIKIMPPELTDDMVAEGEARANILIQPMKKIAENNLYPNNLTPADKPSGRMTSIRGNSDIVNVKPSMPTQIEVKNDGC